MELAQWKSLGTYDYWQGHGVFHVVRQSSPAKPWLLLIHGFPTASFDFHLMWNELGTHFNLITFDMLGFGYSDKPEKWDYSVMQQADIAEYLLRQHGVTRAGVVAHDLGDSVAQELLARHNSGQLGFGLDALVLMNGGLFPETHRALTIQKLLLGPLGPLLSRLTSYRRFRSNLRGICSEGLSEQEIRDAWSLLCYNRGNRRMHQLIRYMPERIEHRSRWVGALQQTHCPILLINGTEDPISGRHMVERFVELVPKGHVLRLGGLGHYPHLEHPRRVFEPLIDFMDVELRNLKEAVP